MQAGEAIAKQRSNFYFALFSYPRNWDTHDDDKAFAFRSSLDENIIQGFS